MPHRQDEEFIKRLEMKEWLFDEIVKLVKTRCDVSGEEEDPIVYNVIRHDVDGYMIVYFSVHPHIIKDKITIKLEYDWDEKGTDSKENSGT